MTVGFSYNPYWVGKPVKVIEPWTDPKTGKVSNRPFMYYEGHKVNLGYKWKNIELSWPDAFDSITIDGYSFAPMLIGAAQGHKCEENFLSHSIAAVDIDSGMTISQLLRDPFYNKYGGGFYVTPSHTMADPRFRILFRLQQRMTDVNDMRDLYTALIKWYGGDKACSDGARLFYGTVGASLYERTDNVLPLDIVQALIKETRDAMKRRLLEGTSAAGYLPPTDGQRQQVVDALAKTFSGEYPVWSVVGWAMRRDGYSLADFQRVTAGMMNQKSPDDAAVVWNAWSPTHHKTATMGSVIYYLKDKLGTLPWDRSKQLWGRETLKIK